MWPAIAMKRDQDICLYIDPFLASFLYPGRGQKYSPKIAEVDTWSTRELFMHFFARDRGAKRKRKRS